MAGAVFFEPAAMSKKIGIVLGDKVPKIFRVVFNFEVGDFVEENMAKLGMRKKNNLPVEVEVSSGGAGAKTGFLIADGETTVTEGKLILETEKLGSDQFFGIERKKDF